MTVLIGVFLLVALAVCLANVQVPESITITRDEFERAAALSDLLRSGAMRPDKVPGLAGELSCNPRPYRKYMTPAAARALSRLSKDEKRALSHLRGKDQYAAFSQPGVGDVHVDAILTEVLVRWANAGYIGRQVFPNVPVTKPSDKYFVFTQGDMFRSQAEVRAPGTRAAGVGYGVSTDNYSCIQYAAEHQVPDEVQQAADAPLDPFSDGARFVSDQIDLRVEKLIAADVFGASTWSGELTLSGTTQWSHTSSTPFTAFKTARLAVWGRTALLPNTLVLGYEVFETLALHADLLDRVKYGGTGDRPAMITAGMMAQLFMVDRVLIGTALENTAYEGATASYASVWGKKAWLGYVNPGPSRERASAGYVFTMGQEADTYREEPTKSDFVRGQEELDCKVVAADCGYLWLDAVA